MVTSTVTMLYKYYMVRGEVGQSIFPEVLATGLLPRTRRVRGNRPVASTEGKIDPLFPDRNHVVFVLLYLLNIYEQIMSNFTALLIIMRVFFASFSKINSSISDSVIEANLLLEAAILAGCYDCGVISSFHAEPP